MNNSIISKTNEILFQLKDDITGIWIETIQKKSLNKVLTESEIVSLCNKIIHTFIMQIEYKGEFFSKTPELSDANKILDDCSKVAVTKGLTLMEVSTFIFSLKNIILDQLGKIDYADYISLSKEFIRISEILDRIGMYTIDMYVKNREQMIARQQQIMDDISAPIIQVWERILAIPLVGTLDSKRIQIVMEKLLDKIASTSSKVAIIDITSIPSVDTQVANQLLKTARATKLLGAELIITGISPEIAQTMVHLGVDITGIKTRAVMADGIKLAMEMTGFKVVRLVK